VHTYAYASWGRHADNLVIRPLNDDNREVYVLPLIFSLPSMQILISQTVDWKHISAWVLGSARKISSDISSTLPLIFTGVKKSDILPRFSTPVAFEALWFRNGAKYHESKTCIGSGMIGFRHFAHPASSFCRDKKCGIWPQFLARSL